MIRTILISIILLWPAALFSQNNATLLFEKKYIPTKLETRFCTGFFFRKTTTRLTTTP